MKLSPWVIGELGKAVAEPGKYSIGEGRKQLQSTYDLMLGEVSQAQFGEQLQGRMAIRQRLLAIPDKKKSKAVAALVDLMRFQDDLFSKDYTGREPGLGQFLDRLGTFLKVIGPA